MFPFLEYMFYSGPIGKYVAQMIQTKAANSQSNDKGPKHRTQTLVYKVFPVATTPTMIEIQSSVDLYQHPMHKR